MRELKPCPNPWCGSTEIETDDVGLYAYAECKHCGLVGPDRITEADAIAAWNERPTPSDRAMVLEEAARAVIDNASWSYRSRGKERYIEDESGERMVLVPHEDWYRLEAAIRQRSSSPADAATSLAS